MATDKKATLLEGKITVAIASWLKKNVAYRGWQPRNYHGSFRGYSSHDINIFSVAILSGYYSHGFTTTFFVALESHGFVFITLEPL